MKKANSSSTGIKEDSSYNQLKYFNPVVNSNEDVSHNWYLEIDSYGTPIFINYWISKRMKDLDFLNLRIINVYYVEEERDKPPTICEKSKQKTLNFYSSQIKTLNKFLPVFIGDS